MSHMTTSLSEDVKVKIWSFVGGFVTSDTQIQNNCFITMEFPLVIMIFCGMFTFNN